MTSRSPSALRKSTAPGKSAIKTSAVKAKSGNKTGKLPEWNLADLYSGIDAPEVARDLQKMDAECVAFETDFKGKLAEHTAGEGGGQWLAEAVRRYEAIDDLAGRLGSYAGLIHAGDSVDPAITKFYGDVSERLTNASVHLLFFALELNRVDDTAIERAMQTPELAHYRPWIEDLRKDKPYQLEDRVEQLFHEKSQSGYAAWNRLFDQTISALRFKVGGRELAIEPTLTLLQDRAGENLQGQRADFRADHQYARQGQGDIRPLARVCRRGGFAASCQSRRARGGRCAGGVGSIGLSAAVASLLSVAGGLVQKEEARALGSQRAAAVCRHRKHRLARRQEHGADGLPRILARNGRYRRALFHRSLDRCAGAARKGARRVLASDHAVGAPLCVDELPGQAARRDDARP